jgi:hypothetical protein
VQVQAVVAPRPRPADALVRLEHDGPHALPLERRRRREAGSARADNDNLLPVHEFNVICNWRARSQHQVSCVEAGY